MINIENMKFKTKTFNYGLIMKKRFIVKTHDDHKISNLICRNQNLRN